MRTKEKLNVDQQVKIQDQLQGSGIKCKKSVWLNYLIKSQASENVVERN